MAEVKLDDEKVDFEGPPPQAPVEVWHLLEGHLAEQGRVLRRFEVDGEAIDYAGVSSKNGYESIQALSMSQEERLLELTADWPEQPALSGAHWRRLAGRALCLSRQEFHEEASETLEAVRPLLQTAGFLAEYGKAARASWGEALAVQVERVNAGLMAWMEAFESGCEVSISESSERALGAELAHLRDLVELRVKPGLAGEGAGE